MTDDTRSPLQRALAMAELALAGDSNEADHAALHALAAEVRNLPETMPAVVHGEPVVSAYRHLPLYGHLDDTFTVITLDQDSPADQQQYTVFRARFAPALERWSIDTDYTVDGGLPWRAAAARFRLRIAESAS